jgi:transposase
MLLWISIFGGLLIMMGHHARSEALFYYFRLEDQVPENHLLRLIDKHISFEFVREQLRDSYSETGRPSIDPELLLRILLIGYLYGITSERKLVEELRMHLAWRWFTGLSLDQEVPHHSTFSKNRHGRFQESKLFEQLFEQIVRQCMEVGLVRGQELSVDGSFVEANAAKQSRIPREQLVEAAQVHQTLRQYLQELEEQNPVEEPAHEQDLVSTTDPDSTYATKGRHTGPVGVLRQLSGGQSQLRDCGSAGNGGAAEPGDRSRASHAHPFRAMARTNARIGGGRHDVRERRVSAMVGRAGNHRLHADARECEAQEQPLLRTGAIYLSARKQQLSLSGWGTAQLRWVECSQSCSRLHWQRQTLRSLLAKNTMHEWTI